MLKHALKKLVKDKINDQAVNFLRDKQNQHSKTRNLVINGEMKDYLKSSSLSTSDKQFLFKLKCGMSPNKLSFKNHFSSDLTCRICRSPGSEESLGHLVRCPRILARNDLPDIENIIVEDLFSDIERQTKSLKIFKAIFSILEESYENDQSDS